MRAHYKDPLNTVKLHVFLLMYATRANGTYISRDVACHHKSSTQGYVGSTFRGARKAGLDRTSNLYRVPMPSWLLLPGCILSWIPHKSDKTDVPFGDEPNSSLAR